MLLTLTSLNSCYHFSCQLVFYGLYPWANFYENFHHCLKNCQLYWCKDIITLIKMFTMEVHELSTYKFLINNVTNTYLFELLLSLLLSTRFLGAVSLGKFLWELPSLSEELSALLLQRYHNINKNVYNGSTWIINIQIFDK